MVFGQRGLRDSMEDSRASDVAGKIPVSLQDPSPGARQVISEVSAILDNRGMPFYRRMSAALSRLDEAVDGNPNDAHLHLTRANLRYQNLDYHLAVADFNRIGKILPGEIFHHAPLARMAIDIGDLEEASSLIKSLADKDPDDIRVLELSASMLEVMEKFAEAGGMLERILQNFAQGPETQLRNKLAALKLDANDPEGALKILNPLVESDTRTSETYRLMGDALAELIRLDDAKDNYLRALHHNSGNLKARFNLGVLYRELGFNNQARNEFDIAVSANPNDPDARFQLFELFQESGNTEGAFINAIQYLLNCDETEDDDSATEYVSSPPDGMTPEMRVLYARFLIEEGETETALEMLESEVEDTATSPPFEVLLSMAYEDEGRIREAIDIAEKALDRYAEDFDGVIVCSHPFPPYETQGGDFSELVCRIAGLFMKLGDVTSAAEALEELQKDDSLAHVGKRILGEIEFIGGNYDSALSLFLEGLGEHPADVDLLASAGAVYQKLGDTEKSINYFLRAYLNEKNDIGVISNLARLFIETHRPTRAKHFLNLVLSLEDEDDQIEWARKELAKLES